jgi:hypothetical protein
MKSTLVVLASIVGLAAAQLTIVTPPYVSFTLR